MGFDENSKAATPNVFKVHAKLHPGEKKLQTLRYRMPPQTRPGIYENTITIGGKARKLKLVVQEKLSIRIIPTVLNFSGVEPGKVYRNEVLMSNTGNVPVTVPHIKHITVLDFDYLCRGLSMAVHAKESEGFTPFMDEVVKNIKKEMADWAVVNLQESGNIVEPGKSITLHFELTLPQNADPAKDYFLNARIWDQTLTIRIKSGKPDVIG